MASTAASVPAPHPDLASPTLTSSPGASTSAAAASAPLAPPLPDLTAAVPAMAAPTSTTAAAGTTAAAAPTASSSAAAPSTTPAAASAPATTSPSPAPAAAPTPAPATAAKPADPVRRLSKRDRSAAQTASSNTAGTGSTAAPSSKSAAAAAGGPGARAQPRRKKKRGVFASLFAALGCVSATAVDDDVARKRDAPASEKAQAKGAAAAPATNGPTTVAAAEPAAATADARQSAGATGSTLVSEQADKDNESVANDADVVVAVPEPTTLPLDETAGVTSSAVQPPGSGSELLAAPHPHLPRRDSEQHVAAGDNQRTETSGGYTDLSDSDEDHHDFVNEEEYEDEEDRLIAQGGMGIPVDEHGNPMPLLPVIDARDSGRMCLVLDLDETLLHSSFKALHQADYIVPVEIESQLHNVYVIKRPGVDHFLEEMGKIYEIVVFTASLSKYADPVLDMLDKKRVVRHRLFRESCYNHKGNYVKDLSQLGRPIEQSIIIDNSPASYIFHPNNAVPVSTWFNDPHDTELTDLCPFLTELATVGDVRGVLDGSI